MAEKRAPDKKNWVATPDVKALLDLFKIDVMQSINCVGVAVVESFDPATQLVKASMAYKRLVNGVAVDYPVLVDCPAVVLSGGPAQLTLPIAQGDECLILFCDRDIDNWHSGGPGRPVNTGRLHSFTDAVALVGLRSKRRELADYDMDHAMLSWGDAQVGVSATKALVKNAVGSLNDVLQELVTEIKDLNTQIQALTVVCAAPGNPSSVPVNVAAFVAIQVRLVATATKIGDLLE